MSKYLKSLEPQPKRLPMNSRYNLKSEQWETTQNIGERPAGYFLARTGEGGGKKKTIIVFLTDHNVSARGWRNNSKMIGGIHVHEGGDVH